MYNGITYDIRCVTCGVPQGQILDILLFIPYINEFAGVSDQLYYVLFVDDTKVFLDDKCIESLLEILHLELSKLHSWILSNKSTLNLSKSTFHGFPSS